MEMKTILVTVTDERDKVDWTVWLKLQDRCNAVLERHEQPRIGFWSAPAEQRHKSVCWLVRVDTEGLLIVRSNLNRIAGAFGVPVLFCTMENPIKLQGEL